MRGSYARDLINRCAYLDAHRGTAFPLAMQMRLSHLRAYFESEVHQQALKGGDADAKLAAAQINRLDGVIKAIGHLGKILARR